MSQYLQGMGRRAGGIDVETTKFSPGCTCAARPRWSLEVRNGSLEVRDGNLLARAHRRGNVSVCAPTWKAAPSPARVALRVGPLLARARHHRRQR